MQSPLEIAFHNMPSDPGLEAYIRGRAAKLDRMFDRITGCRVSVEALHRQHQTGNVVECHIDIVVPGAELAVSREPNKAKQKYATPDARTAIRDAFKAAERQLKEYKAKLRGEVKAHDYEVPGQISQLYPEEDHGFILTNTGTQLYFHRNSVMNNGFDLLQQGMPVHYVEAMGDTGPTASKVWPVEDVEAQRRAEATADAIRE